MAGKSGGDLFVVAKGPGRSGPGFERDDWVTDTADEFCNGRIGQYQGQGCVRWVVQPTHGDRFGKWHFVEGDWLTRQRIARVGVTGDQRLSTPTLVLPHSAWADEEH